VALSAEMIKIDRIPLGAGSKVAVRHGEGLGEHKFVITVNSLSDADATTYFHAIELMTQAFTARLQALPEERIATLVSMLLPEKPVRSTLLREAKMLAKAKTRILQSNDWITAGDVSELAQFKSTNSSSQPNKWKQTGKIFALRHDGVDYFPIYGLDPDTGYRPISRLVSIIEMLARKKDGWGMAFWFGSSNSYLAGKLPKDLLKTDPQRVLDAAEQEVCGVMHG